MVHAYNLRQKQQRYIATPRQLPIRRTAYMNKYATYDRASHQKATGAPLLYSHLQTEPALLPQAEQQHEEHVSALGRSLTTGMLPDVVSSSTIEANPRRSPRQIYGGACGSDTTFNATNGISATYAAQDKHTYPSATRWADRDYLSTLLKDEMAGIIQRDFEFITDNIRRNYTQRAPKVLGDCITKYHQAIAAHTINNVNTAVNNITKNMTLTVGERRILATVLQEARHITEQYQNV